MLILGIGEEIVKACISLLYKIVLAFAALIYDFINVLYQIFMAIAQAQLFNNKFYADFANRVYVVVGIVALFFIAYGLLRAIIDPDNAAKSDTAPTKIVKNVLIAIALIAVTPWIFSVMYNMQHEILANNIIGKIIVGNNSDTGDTYQESGRIVANDLFMTFFFPPSTEEKWDDTTVVCDLTGESENEFDECLEQVVVGSTNLRETREKVISDGGFFRYIPYSAEVANHNIKYNWIFQLVAGGFLVYVFLSMCIDLGLRAVKLAYYQLIAPIPIFTLIIPGQKKIFDNWLKGALSTFAQVFIQLAAVFLGFYLIDKLPNPFKSGWNAWGTGINPPLPIRVFAFAFIIMGVIMFMKQAPKLVFDMFGIKEGSFKLGIADKLREGGIFAAGGALASVGTSMANKIVGAPKNFQNFKNAWRSGDTKKRAALLAGAATGGVGNLIRFGKAGVEGYKSTKDAKSVTEWAEGIQKGTARALSEPTMKMKVTGAAADVAQATRTAVTTDYTPYDSQRELRKAKKYDGIKSKRDEINTYIDADKKVKAIDDAYNATIDKYKKAVEDGVTLDYTYTDSKGTHTISVNDADTLSKVITKVRAEWITKKDATRAEVIGEKLKNKDLKMQSLLQSYAGELVQNRQVLKESIIENYAERDVDGNIIYGSNGKPVFNTATDIGKKGQSLLDNFENLSDDEIKAQIVDGSAFKKSTHTNGGVTVDYIFGNEPSTASGRSSTAIHQRAMEEEAKKEGK